MPKHDPSMIELLDAEDAELRAEFARLTEIHDQLQAEREPLDKEWNEMAERHENERSKLRAQIVEHQRKAVPIDRKRGKIVRMLNGKTGENFNPQPEPEPEGEAE